MLNIRFSTTFRLANFKIYVHLKVFFQFFIKKIVKFERLIKNNINGK